MAKIEKLKKGTATIYPATIPQAVVDPESGKSARTELDEKANHGYESNPKSLKEVDDEKADHGYAVEETPKTLKEVDTLATQNAEDISQLAGEVSQKVSYGDIFTIVGFYIKGDGTLTTYAPSKVTPLIPLNRNTDLIIVGHESTAQRVCYFYDKFKNPISGYSTGTSNTTGRFVVPKAEFPINAVYFRANALVTQTNARIESLSVEAVTQGYADKSTLNLYSNDTIFDKENSTGNYLEMSKYIDDIMILNPEDGAVYTVTNLSKTRVAVRKNGAIYADNQYVVGTQSEWFKVNPTFGVLNGGEQIFVKYNPEITPTINTLDSFIISKNKFYNSNDLDLQEVLQRRLYEVNTFDDAKLEITNAVKELYIQGYTSTQVYIGYISNRGDEVEVRIQDTSGAVLQTYRGVPKEVIYINDPTVKIVIAIDWSKITREHSSLYLRSWHKLNDRCFNLAYCPIANSLLRGDAIPVSEEKLFSGNILDDGIFANPTNFTDRFGDFVCDFYEAGGYSKIEYIATLGVNALSNYKFAPSNFSPSPNFKINNALRKGFEGNDKFRIRGKIYVDKGDATYADDISISLKFMKDGSYPDGADVVGTTSSILVKNKVWKDFEFIGILGDDLGVQNVSFRPTFAENNPIVSQQKRISITNLSVEFFKDGVVMPSETTYRSNVCNKQNIVEAVISSLKSDKNIMSQLILNQLKTYNCSADMFFNKLQTLISQTEILYLKDSHRLPSMQKNAIVVEEGVLYYYHNGAKYSINVTEII